MTSRRSFLAACASAGFPALFAEGLWKQVEAAPAAAGVLPTPREARITVAMVEAAENIAGLRFSDAERRMMLASLENNLAMMAGIREHRMPNAVQPALRFSPVLPGRQLTGSRRRTGAPAHSRPRVRRPTSDAALAFLPVLELAELLRTRQVTSTELTRLYLHRLARYGEVLKCVVTLLEPRALEQAAQADREIAAGEHRGPLHGIPYGVKDILAVPGYPTTWGAAVFRDRIINETATVIERLDRAGAVLVAKLAMGELGLSDQWYGGVTANPWKPGEGSRGSSSGSAVAAAAGLVAFSIGAETMGSILVPSARTGVTGLRPTFGRVSRHGAMTLCWSLDKIGPIARTVEDCAVILEAIAGPDGKDPTVLDVPFEWDPARRLSDIRIGYFAAAFEFGGPNQVRDQEALAQLRGLGVTPVPIEMPTDIPVNALLLIRVEAAAALEEVSVEGGLDLLAEQHEGAWPNFIKSSQFVPAVDYIQANRIRTRLMERLETIFAQVDVFMAPTLGVMPATNFTGHPAIVMQNGFTEQGIPGSISFIGRLGGEADLCTVAKAWQDRTGWHLKNPPQFEG